MILRRTLACALLMGVGMTAAQAQNTASSDATQPLQSQDVVGLDTWNYDNLYASGWRAGSLLDSGVYGPENDEIGEVEDIIVGPDGQILSVVAEIGGFLDIGDTHVSVPWDQVETVADGNGVRLPITEENLEDYGLYANRFDAEVARTEITEVDDQEVGDRAWRVNELIGDYILLAGGDEYGYVDDLIFDQSGTLQAVVASPDIGYGTRGFYAYPYYGYNYGWRPGYDYYVTPYTRDDISEMDPFEYGEIENQTF